jgi:hypothetical protein
MTPPPGIPTVRELMAEFARIEDRMRSVEAQVYGGKQRPPIREQVRLAQREREVLALLRQLQAKQ